MTYDDSPKSKLAHPELQTFAPKEITPEENEMARILNQIHEKQSPNVQEVCNLLFNPEGPASKDWIPPEQIIEKESKENDVQEKVEHVAQFDEESANLCRSASEHEDVETLAGFQRSSQKTLKEMLEGIGPPTKSERMSQRKGEPDRPNKGTRAHTFDNLAEKPLKSVQEQCNLTSLVAGQQTKQPTIWSIKTDQVRYCEIGPEIMKVEKCKLDAPEKHENEYNHDQYPGVRSFRSSNMNMNEVIGCTYLFSRPEALKSPLRINLEEKGSQRAKIGDKTVPIQFDSGASNTFIMEKTVRNSPYLQNRPTKSVRKTRVQIANGHSVTVTNSIDRKSVV